MIKYYSLNFFPFFKSFDFPNFLSILLLLTLILLQAISNDINPYSKNNLKK